jgi:hypothetical protein
MFRSAGYPPAAVTMWGLLCATVSSVLRHVEAFNLTSVRYLLANLIPPGLPVAREGRGALRSGGRGAELVLLGATGFASTCWPTSR